MDKLCPSPERSRQRCLRWRRAQKLLEKLQPSCAAGPLKAADCPSTMAPGFSAANDEAAGSVASIPNMVRRFMVLFESRFKGLPRIFPRASPQRCTKSVQSVADGDVLTIRHTA